MARIVWLVDGLAPTITGIERIALALAAELLDSGIATREDFLVHGDHGSEVRAELEALGLPCTDPRALTARSAATERPRLVHNFGRSIRLARGADSYLYSLWDWGPFHDREMPLKARLAWTSAITIGHARATDVHYLNARLPDLRPRPVPRPSSWFVCFAETSRALRDAVQADAPEFALFVGTATQRKRLDVLARIGSDAGWPVELVGQGTERWSAPGVHGHGRVDEVELEQYFRRAACMLLISSYEGFGVPILEGARRGIHSVVSTEVMEILPDSLRAFCHPLSEPTGPALAAAVAAATAARGTSYFREDLLQPLLGYYARKLAG